MIRIVNLIIKKLTILLFSRALFVMVVTLPYRKGDKNVEFKEII